MSRAFVKELDGDDVLDSIPERLHSDLPNYITREGLRYLKSEVRRLETDIATSKTNLSIDARSRAEPAKRDLRYLRERVRRAIPTEVPESPSAVQFGVTVRLLAEDGCTHQFTLVGEDETNIEAGHISWASPIGHLLIGHEIGDEVVWPRDNANLKVEIIDLWGLRENSIVDPH